jgi:hypothetical protein
MFTTNWQYISHINLQEKQQLIWVFTTIAGNNFKKQQFSCLQQIDNIIPTLIHKKNNNYFGCLQQ